MKVLRLENKDNVYSSNVYLILGTWNRLEDVNTIIDTGTFPSILDRLEEINSGVGKKKVEQIILTHNHYDHTGNLPALKKQYGPRVMAFADGPLVDEHLVNGRKLIFGDRSFEVIHTPVHSSDSICLYCGEEGVLFSGDAPLKILSDGGTYGGDFISILESFLGLNIQIIYPGHDEPCGKNINRMLERTLKNVRAAMKSVK